MHRLPENRDIALKVKRRPWTFFELYPPDQASGRRTFRGGAQVEVCPLASDLAQT